MSLLLFAAEDNPDTAPSGLVLLAGTVVAILVLRWLYTIGFYGKALKAVTKTLAALAIVSVGVYAAASFTDQSKNLEEFAHKNLDGLCVFGGLWVIAGLFAFYGSSTPTPPAITSKPKPKPVAVAAAGAAGGVTNAAPAMCPTCRGSGQTEYDCSACSGMGEIRCTNKDSAWWWGSEVVYWWCVGGVMTDNMKATNGMCPSCNGRGFHRCSSCRGRGRDRGTCSSCSGTGTV